MADYKEVNGVFGGVEFGQGGDVENAGSIGETVTSNGGVEGEIGVVNAKNLPVKRGFWSKFKAFWLQEIDWKREIKVELTPYQQKVEDEINEFLHQEITWTKVHDFLFQEVKFGKKNKV